MIVKFCVFKYIIHVYLIYDTFKNVFLCFKFSIIFFFEKKNNLFLF
jgi:hypothetical protein